MKLPTPLLSPLLAALALAAPAAPALAADQGPCVVAAAGRTSYDYDCYFLYDCNNAGANGGKVVAGYDGKTDHVESTLGLGLMVDLAPALALEFAWDATSATGKNSGSVLAQSLSAGLRLKF